MEFTAERRPRTWAEAKSAFRQLREADFARSPSLFHRITSTIWRAGQVLLHARGPVAFVVRRFVLVADLVWTQTLMGAELPHEVWAGPGVKLEHGARGVIMHPSTVIGSEVTIYHRVTIGVRDARPAATIGDRVELGTGATLLGPVQVADGSRVGANAVLLNDTEPDCTYVGVPAKRVGEQRVVETYWEFTRPAWMPDRG
ncbi:MAG: hypothetical protein Q4G46_01755 [Propionibacteriaceae bacterium]|nr:hypothetical protein [Propionibacteriaceae bacterium]